MRVVRVEVTVRDTHVHVHAGDIRRLNWRLHEEIENHNSLGCKQPPVLGVRPLPMHRTYFHQYQASSAALGSPGVWALHVMY